MALVRIRGVTTDLVRGATNRAVESLASSPTEQAGRDALALD